MVRTSEVSSENIQEWLEGIDQFNATPEPMAGTTRLVFTPEEMGARDYVKSVMREIGLEIEEDGIGNVFGVLKGSEADLAPVWSGSHIDTVPHAGMYDGMTGIVAAIETLRSIKDSGEIPRRSLKAIIFTSEEPTRFKNGCLGSRALAGKLTYEDCERLTDDQEVTLAEQMQVLGYTKETFCKVEKRKGDVHAMVELHIEQAEKLEKGHKQIGIVRAITAYRTMIFSLKGKQDHAGGTIMSIRKDAVCAMAEIISAIEKFAKETGRQETVATVGKIEVYPNATNIISGDVKFSLDLREDDRDMQLKVFEQIIELANKVVAERQLEMTYEILYDDLPALASSRILSDIQEACEQENLSYKFMRSGAGHDSQLVSLFTDYAMIFIPCKDGISHNPAEYANYTDIVNGTKVLKRTLLKLANEED